MNKRTMNDFANFLGASPRGTVAPDNATTSKPFNVASMDNSLATPLANTDLGMFGNYSLGRQTNKAKRRALGAIVETQYEELTKLGKEALMGKVQLLREELRTEFNRDYAVIAERSAASEMQAIRRFEAVLQAGRDLLINDRMDVLKTMDERHERGEITDDEFREEIDFYISRYVGLKQEFTDLIDIRRAAVKGAFRPAAN